MVFNYLSLKFNTMKTLTITLALLLGSMAFSQDIVYKNGLYIKNEAVYSGKYSNYFENGALKETLTIKDGKLNGEIINTMKMGTKMEVGQFENNLKFGLWTWFNTGGSAIAEAFIKMIKKMVLGWFTMIKVLSCLKWNIKKEKKLVLGNNGMKMEKSLKPPLIALCNYNPI